MRFENRCCGGGGRKVLLYCGVRSMEAGPQQSGAIVLLVPCRLILDNWRLAGGLAVANVAAPIQCPQPADQHVVRPWRLHPMLCAPIGIIAPQCLAACK